MFESGLSYMLTYIITTLFAFLGVYVGAVLAFICPEELKPGKGYLRSFMNTVLIFLALILLYAYGAHIAVLILLGVAATIFLYYTSDNTPINQIAYFILGIALFFAARSTDLFITISSMIFIYGLPLGSLFVLRKGKKSKRTILADILLNFGFFVIVALMTNLILLYVTNI
ncbi:hypothetical protein KY363_02300 [Candidatus Woesearchaeota archaeon]|nr:hypothetical protein [Candidatus Woesearchaeota archaeon]